MRLFKIITRWLFGVIFVFAGVNHFLNPDFYVRIVPPYLPWHVELVYASGACEISLGRCCSFPSTFLWPRGD